MTAQNTIIKKKGKTEPALLLYWAHLYLLFSSAEYWGTFQIKESNELTEKKLAQAILTKKAKADELNNLENTLLIISRLIGWRNEAPWTRGAVKGNWTTTRIGNLIKRMD